MKQYLNNIQNNKVTSTVGITMLIILLLKLFKVDLGELFDTSLSELALYIGTGISGILHLFSKDPK